MKYLSDIFVRLRSHQEKIYIVLFVIFSFLPILQFIDEVDKDIIASKGDYIFILEIKKSFFENFFVYSPVLSMENTTPISLSLYSPFYIYLYIMSYLGFKPIISELLFIPLIYFVGFLSMYQFLLYVFKDKIKLISSYGSFTAFCGSILYSFSPFFFFYYGGGHYLFLIYIALFPLFLKYFDLFLTTSYYNYKYILYIFLIFIFSSLPYGNLGIILVHFIVIFAYILLFLLIYKAPIFKIINKTLIVLGIFLMANTWWLLPTVFTLNNLSALNEQSKSTIGAAISSATRKAKVMDVFMGVPDSPMQIFSYNLDYIAYASVNAIYLILVIITILYFISTKTVKFKYSIIILFLMLSALYITKGPNLPFPEFFMFLYDNVLGFQVFRRPASKIYWLFLFTLVTLSMISIIYFYTKLHINKIRYLITSFLLISIVIFSLVAMHVKGLQTYNIPEIYYKAGLQLENENASKLLLLPDLAGYPIPRYNQSLNYFTGVDFINQIWKYPKYTPDNSMWTLKTPQRDKLNVLSSNIYNKKSLCKLTRELNVSHIILRYDLDDKFYSVKELNNLYKSLKTNPDIYKVKDYKIVGHKNFSIFSLKNDCRTNLIFINKVNAEGFLKQISPVNYRMNLYNIKGEQVITLLKMYDTNWKIYINNNDINNSCLERNETNSKFNNIIFCRTNLATPSLNELEYIWKESFFAKSHKQIYGYANSWTIDTDYIKNNLSDNYYDINQDGSLNMSITFYYKPQLYLYIGLFISVATFLFLIFVFIIKNQNNKK